MTKKKAVYCESCGVKIEKESHFCSECGARVCSKCGETVSETANFCEHCGAKLDGEKRHETIVKETIVVVPQKNPFFAAILSFVIPGLGQVYNGQVEKGIVLVLLGVIAYLLWSAGIGIIFSFILWVYAIYDAYKCADEANKKAKKR